VLRQLQKVLVYPEDLECLARLVDLVYLGPLQYRMGLVYLATLVYLVHLEDPEDLALLQPLKDLECPVSPECLARLVTPEALARPVLLEYLVSPV
jgi:hypothetical protein